ncbi:MAG: hypothetical protein HDR88_11605 [Bacteroides sp.]|nr:hypothetical protein [Bacteroides sp.]
MSLIPQELTARKIKQSLKINKEKYATTTNKDNTIPKNRELSAEESSYLWIGKEQVLFSPDSISFAGYEKEVNANNEAFLVVNNNDVTLTGIKIKIVYYDLKNRMLHSRTLIEDCIVPPHETRKVYISSWDKQKSHFYYLCNEPKKIATPYKVKIIPLAFFIED